MYTCAIDGCTKTPLRASVFTYKSKPATIFAVKKSRSKPILHIRKPRASVEQS